MSERFFRIVLGVSLIMLLYFRLDELVYLYIAILAFEGLTNWRIPIVISRVRYGTVMPAHIISPCESMKINFDAERALRIVVALMLVVTFGLFKEEIWLFPWFIGFMLLSAGVTNICPMNMFLRWVGFK